MKLRYGVCNKEEGENKVKQPARKSRFLGVAAGLLLSTLTAFNTPNARAEDNKTAAVAAQTVVAQNNQTYKCDKTDYRGCTKEQLEQKYKTLSRFSLEDMQKFAAETRKKYQDGVLFSDIENGPIFSTGVFYRWMNGGLRAFVGLCSSEKCHGYFTHNKFFTMDTSDKVVEYVDLEEQLEPLYKLVTGKELRYARLVIDEGYDNEVGAHYVGITVVPVDRPGGEIKAGTPMLAFTYYIETKELYKAPLIAE